jgi:hypothetical protein
MVAGKNLGRTLGAAKPQAASRKPWTSETIEKRYYEAMGRLEEDSRERRMLEAERLRLSAK